jgi:hypothetical protein
MRGNRRFVLSFALASHRSVLAATHRLDDLMFQLAVDMRNAGLDAYEVALGTDPIFRVMTGSQPINCAAAESGTRLVSVTMPSDWMLPAADGTKMMLGTWQSISVLVAGFAGYYRIYEKTGAACKLQGPVAQAWFPGSLFFAGQRLAYGTGIYVCTSSGTTDVTAGPTGTGTNILNGTAVFDYVDTTRGMVLVDDTNFKVGQPFTIRSYAWTAGNA